MSIFLERARAADAIRFKADKGEAICDVAVVCWPEIVAVVAAAQKLICSNDPISDLGGVDDALDALDLAAGER